MYRHGLGDCFLVTLPKTDGAPFYIMIDCGVIARVAAKPSIMEDGGREHRRGHRRPRRRPGRHARALGPRVGLRHRAGAVRWRSGRQASCGRRGLVRMDGRPGRCARQPAAARNARSARRNWPRCVAQQRMQAERRLGSGRPHRRRARLFRHGERRRKPRARPRSRGTGSRHGIRRHLAPVRYCRPTDEPTGFRM